MNVVAYMTPVSSPRETAGEQREELSRWATRHRARITASYEEATVGDGPLFKARPALMDALSMLRGEAKVEALLITSRTWLSPFDEAIVEGVVRRAGGRLVAADGSGPSKQVARLVDVCDTYARALSSVGTRAKRRDWRAKGAPYGQIPWGFRASADGKRLVRDKTEQRVVSVIAHMRASGFKLHEIAEELARSGMRSRRGGRIGIPRVFELLRDIEEGRYGELSRVLGARRTNVRRAST
jgi:hypothetical protein